MRVCGSRSVRVVGPWARAGSPRSSSKDTNHGKGLGQAHRRHPRVHDVQAPQLHHHQEQGERPRAHRDEEVLPLGPHPHGAQGDAVAVPSEPGSRSSRPGPSSFSGSGYRHVTRPAHRRSDPPMPREVAELVAAAQDGDREAFDELVRATYAESYTLALRLTGNEEDARDVVQEAYLRAFRGLRRFRGDARFSTWMYRITANCA